MAIATAQDGSELLFNNYVKQEMRLAQNASVRAIVQDAFGFAWLATGKGLYRFDGTTFEGFYPVQDDPESISDTEIMSLYADSLRIWIGTALQGVDVYNMISGKFVRISAFPDSLGRVWCIAETNDGYIWAGTDYALIRIDAERMTHDAFVMDTAASGDASLIIRGIIPVHASSKLWLATRGGLMQFDSQTRQFTSFPMPFDIQYHLTGGIELSGSLWFSSYQGGIIGYTPRTKEWAQYHLPDSMVETSGNLYDVVYHLVRKTETELWFTAFDAVGTFEINTGTFGLIQKDIENPLRLYPSTSYRSLFVADAGYLFIGGSDVISVGYPSTSRQLDYAPVIIAFPRISSRSHRDTNTLYTRLLVLGDRDRNLDIEMTVPEYITPGDVQFRYILDGFDSEWVRAGTGKHARYTNLPPGSYTFRYQASLDGLNWKDGLHALHIERTTVLWKRPWFIVLCVVVVATVMWILNVLRVGRIRRDAQRQTAFDKKLAEVEMTALRAQMNPHFIFNALSSIKYFILENEITTANDHLTKFSQLIRAVLRNSKSTLVPLSDELQALRLYIELEAVRFTEKFAYQIDLDDRIDPTQIVIPPLLIQPYAENAIWHGLLHKKAPGHLYVRVLARNSILHIEIEDNGIGRAASARLKSKLVTQKKSMGMQITKDRVALIKQSMGIDSKVQIEDLYTEESPSGTRVTIEIPLMPRNADNT